MDEDRKPTQAAAPESAPGTPEQPDDREEVLTRKMEDRKIKTQFISSTIDRFDEGTSSPKCDT